MITSNDNRLNGKSNRGKSVLEENTKDYFVVKENKNLYWMEK